MPPSPRPSRARTRARRAVAIGVVVVAAGGIFFVVKGGGPSEQDTVVRFAHAWDAGNYSAMRDETTGEDQDRYSGRTFAARYTDAAGIATATRVKTGRPYRSNGTWQLPVTVTTRAFGPVRGTVALKVVKDGDDERIDWAADDTFPGLHAGDRLTRTTEMPARGDLLARDGTPLAQGPNRTSPLGPTAAAIVGALGPIPDTYKSTAARLGYPSDAQVGITGLERSFDARLAGTPGGQLRAGARLLAERAPRKAAPVRTTIAPKVEAAAVEALAGRYGGVVALRPKTGEILAAAGIGFSGLQPPGSTFKIITATGVLQNGVAKPTDTFPVQTAATIEGVQLGNANGESCGGTLANSFAQSCNSVFAPLGAKLGAQKLVQTAEAFGFNQPTGITGAATASIPPAGEIGDDLAVGSSAIGQGRVQATALQMAIVAATIGLRGRRPDVTLDPDRWKGRAPTHAATDARTAREVEKLMLGVVRYGTGKVADIPGVKVAGKTGTAELRSTQTCQPSSSAATTGTPAGTCTPNQENDTSDTDAWFSTYAPAGNGTPRIAVGVLLVAAGAGGDTAAPAARQVLLAGLKN